MNGKKFDGGKPRMDLLPPLAEVEVAKVLGFGAHKYGAWDWLHVKDAQSRYLAAGMRHLNEFRVNPDAKDVESGLPSLAHAIASLSMVLEHKLREESRDAHEEKTPIAIHTFPG